MTVRSSLSKKYLTKHQTVSEFDLSVGFYRFFASVCKTALCFSHCLSFFFNFSFFSLAFLGGLWTGLSFFACLPSDVAVDTCDQYRAYFVTLLCLGFDIFGVTAWHFMCFRKR